MLRRASVAFGHGMKMGERKKRLRLTQSVPFNSNSKAYCDDLPDLAKRCNLSNKLI